MANRDANDNHVDVVNIILDTHSIPDKSACWSCYQPKLYYLISSGLVMLFHVSETFDRMLVMQLLNVFLAFFIQLLIWKYIDSFNIKDKHKQILFAFFAFNSCLTGINVQGTNDTLIILLGVITVHHFTRYIKEGNNISFLLASISMVLALLTKASAIIITAVTIFFLLLQLVFSDNPLLRKQVLKQVLILITCVILIVPFAGGYYSNYKKYGNFTLSTWEKDKPPLLFEKTYVTRPGIENIAEGFFTFRWIDLIRQPYINNEQNNFPLHRTSLWSQLYGRTVFMHYDQWPISWQWKSETISKLGSTLMILGIIPLFLFLAGLVTTTIKVIRNVINFNRFFFTSSVSFYCWLLSSAFLASSIYYSYTYRDFSSMKSIYILPGLIAFIEIFISGYILIKSKHLQLITNSVLLIISTLYIVDMLLLFQHIAPPSLFLSFF